MLLFPPAQRSSVFCAKFRAPTVSGRVQRYRVKAFTCGLLGNRSVAYHGVSGPFCSILQEEHFCPLSPFFCDKSLQQKDFWFKLS